MNHLPLTIKSFCQRGETHRQQHLPCQDWAAQVSEKTKGAVSLCDGAGGFARSGASAQLASRLIAEYLIARFSNCLTFSPVTIQHELTLLLEKEFSDFAAFHAISTKQMACTILAAAMDVYGNCLCLHLGDGLLLRRQKNADTFQIISSPDNGITGNTTYLTMNCSLYRHLQFFRWKDRNTQEIYLLTDGADTALRGGSTGDIRFPCSAEFSSIKSYLISCKIADDASIAAIARLD